MKYGGMNAIEMIQITWWLHVALPIFYFSFHFHFFSFFFSP